MWKRFLPQPLSGSAFILGAILFSLAIGSFSCANLPSLAPEDPRAPSEPEESKEDLQSEELPLMIPPLASTLHFSTDLKGRDIAEEFTQALEEEVWPDPLSMESLPLPEEPEAEDPAFLEDPEFEITLKETSVMRDYLAYYTQSQRQTFQSWLQRSERYLPHIKGVFQEHDLPKFLIFLPFAESGFNPWAYSRAGAAGVWQFMPATARQYGLQVNWWIDERRDPYRSTEAAARYLKELHRQFDCWYLALAAYNAGGGTVNQAQRLSGRYDYYRILDETRYLPRETREYVPKFKAILKIVKNLETYGFAELNLDNADNPTRLDVPSGTDLTSLSERMGMEWDEFRNYNPFLRRHVTPPGEDTTIYIPEQKKEVAQNHVQQLREQPEKEYARYRIQQGDSWWRLSRRFDVPIHILKDLNNKSSDILHPGESVLVPTTHAGGGERVAGSEDLTTYVVQTGDTLSEIASRFDLSLAQIRRANDLSSGQSLIRPGQELHIPREGRGHQKADVEDRANYTVQEGDSLWEIARRFDVGLDTLVAANNLDDPANIRKGMELFIPGLAETPGPVVDRDGGEIVYRVQKGDNLWGIARKFGVSTEQIISWNKLGQEHRIHPGDKLRIRLQD